MKKVTFKYLATSDVLNFLAVAELISYRLDANSTQLSCIAEHKLILLAKACNMEVLFKKEF